MFSFSSSSLLYQQETADNQAVSKYLGSIKLKFIYNGNTILLVQQIAIVSLHS